VSLSVGTIAQLLSARRYASVGSILAMALCPCLYDRVSVCHKSVFYRNGWTK